MLLAVETILRQEVGVREGDRILVGVSGGADSVALLHLLSRLAPSFPFSLHAAHLDHGLREKSAEDVKFVQDLCRSLGAALTTGEVDVPGEACRRKSGIEETARALRREFFERVARSEGCRWIALGHHRGDQAETIVHRFLRGTSLSGLAGMRMCSAPYIRPLLRLSKGQILSYVTSQGLSWVEDETNRDQRFTRNQIRWDLLPRMLEINPRIEEALARLSDRILREEDFWSREVSREVSALARFEGDGCVLGCAELLSLHPALRFRLLRQVLEMVRGDLLGIGSVHLDAIENLLKGDRPQGEVHLPRVWIFRRYQELRFRSGPALTAEQFSADIEGEGEYLLPDGRILSVEKGGTPAGENPCCVEFDAAQIRFPLKVRGFLPGDRFRPSGAKGTRKLKKFFIDTRVEREVRLSIPIVVGEEILWLVGMRRCHGRRPLPGGAIVRLIVHNPPKARL